LEPPWSVTRAAPALIGQGDEDVFAAVFGQRLAGEAAVEGFHLEAGDIDEAEPLVLRRPPDGAPGAVVEREVDAVVAYRGADCVWYRLVLVNALEPRGDAVLERNGVPGEPAVRLERGATRSNVRRRSAQVGSSARSRGS
jgi:hypothetical protein